jgi:hypothetical protein
MVWSVGSQSVFLGPRRFREFAEAGECRRVWKFLKSQGTNNTIYEGMEGPGESGGVQSMGILEGLTGFVRVPDGC